MIPIKRILILGLFLMQVGCQYVGVTSSQLSPVVNALFGSATEPATLWVAEYGGYSAHVYPISVNAETLFANNDDAITFDGWRFSKIKGLRGFVPAWEIQDSGSERSFIVNGKVVATHQCNVWVKQDNHGGVRFEQDCIGQTAYTNTILVDNLGQITSIKQVVDTSLMVLRLRIDN